MLSIWQHRKLFIRWPKVSRWFSILWVYSGWAICCQFHSDERSVKLIAFCILHIKKKKKKTRFTKVSSWFSRKLHSCADACCCHLFTNKNQVKRMQKNEKKKKKAFVKLIRQVFEVINLIIINLFMRKVLLRFYSSMWLSNNGTAFYFYTMQNNAKWNTEIHCDYVEKFLWLKRSFTVTRSTCSTITTQYVWGRYGFSLRTCSTLQNWMMYSQLNGNDDGKMALYTIGKSKTLLLTVCTAWHAPSWKFWIFNHFVRQKRWKFC